MTNSYFSIVDYIYTGQESFTAPSYLQASDITVTVSGVEKTQGVDYTLTGTTVKFELLFTPNTGAKIRIQRSSGHDARRVDFNSGSMLKAETLDADSNQMFYLAQEAMDTAKNISGDYNARYWGSLYLAPTNPSVGDLWFDNTNKVMKVYNTQGWQVSTSAVTTSSNRVVYTVGTPSGNYTGSASLFPVTYDSGFVDVYLNGVKLVSGSDFQATNGSTIYLSQSASSGDTVDIIAYGETYLSDDIANKLDKSGGTLTGDIEFGTNKAKFLGLEIYNTVGNNSIISETGTGNLFIRGEDVRIQTPNGEDVIKGEANDAVTLYHDNSPKLETTDTGISVLGAGAKISLPNLDIYQDTYNTSVIEETGLGHLVIKGTDVRIQTSTGEDVIKGEADGAVTLYYDNSPKLATTNTGISVTGTIQATGYNNTLWDYAVGWGNHASAGYLSTSGGTMTGDLDFGANKAKFVGLEIYNTVGNNSIIEETGTGSLYIRGEDVRIQTATGENILWGEPDGAVRLSYDGNERLTTTNSGIIVTGTIQGSGYNDANWNAAYNDKINAVSYSNNTLTLTQQDGTTLTTTINASGGGSSLWSANSSDIYYNSGNVGIGTTSPSSKLTVVGDIEQTTGDLKYTGGINWDIAHHGAGQNIVFSTTPTGGSATQRMRIDSSGNVLVGKTSSSFNTAGVEFASSGRSRFTRDSANVIEVNRTTNDGSLVTFNKDGSTVGSIGTASSGITFASGGSTERMRIDSSGNVGIGTTSPSDKLEVASSSSVNIKLNNTGNGTSLLLGAQATAARLTAGSGDKLGLGANNTADGLVLDTSNNVGIGATAPAEKLEVQGRVTVNNSYGYRIGATSTGDAHVGDLTNTSGVLTLRTEGNRNMRFDTAGSERMRISSTGNVGIGTSNPSADLHVKTDATGSGVTPTADTGLFIDGQYSTTLQLGAYWAGQTQINFGTGSGPGGSQTPIKGQIAYNNYSNYMAFRTGGTERFRCTSGGQLLVGTTSSQDTTSKILTTGRVSASNFIASSNVSKFYNSGTQGYAGIQLYSYSSYSTSSQKMMSFFSGANQEYGSITIAGFTTSFNTSSDERLKENIKDAEDAGDKIDAIKIRQFDWKENGEHQDYGVIAQELDEVAPEAVTKGVTEDDMMSVDYSKLVPTLIKEIQSLRNRVAELEKN